MNYNINILQMDAEQIEQIEQIEQSEQSDEHFSEEHFSEEYISDDSRYSFGAGKHYRRRQHLSDWCSEYIKKNLDTGYDLLRNMALLSSVEQNKIVVSSYTFVNGNKDYYIIIAVDIHIHVLLFSDDDINKDKITLTYCYPMLHGKPTGHYYMWHPDTHLLEDGYFDKNARRTGRCRRYGMSWIKHPIEEGFYKDDKKTGYWYYMDYCGEFLSSGYYENGTRTGCWILTDRKGGRYKKDFREGEDEGKDEDSNNDDGDY